MSGEKYIGLDVPGAALTSSVSRRTMVVAETRTGFLSRSSPERLEVAPGCVHYSALPPERKAGTE